MCYEKFLPFLNGGQVQEFVRQMCANQIDFFHMPKMDDYLFKTYLPSWCKKNPDNVFRIWFSGILMGNEPYSFAIYCEEFRNKYPEFAYQITVSDMSQQSLYTAKTGSYIGHAIENFKLENTDLFQKYFRAEKNGYIINAELKTKVRFEVHEFEKFFGQEDDFDLVFLNHNLLSMSCTKDEVINNISRSLVKNGLLIVEDSPSSLHLQKNFRLIKQSVYANNKSE